MFEEINTINPNSDQEKSDSLITDNIISEESLSNEFEINSSPPSILMTSYQNNMKQFGKQLKFRYKKIKNAYPKDSNSVVQLYFFKLGLNTYDLSENLNSIGEQFDRYKSACAYTGRYLNYDFILDRFYERSEMTEILFYETYMGFKNKYDFLLKIAPRNSWDIDKQKITPSRIILSGNEFLDDNILFEAVNREKLESVLQSLNLQQAITKLFLYTGKFYILENGIYHKADFQQMTNQKLLKIMQLMMEVGKAFEKTAHKSLILSD
ncbi:hypothetical protein GF337_13375 [candidate division KSB1 bacterium]|nr:hypothetical protein [candidate division KSB1 bacterium]